VEQLRSRIVANARYQEGDDLARQLRETDVRIQESNWQFDLLE